MPALQVKDFPSDLYEELRECAARQDRSISQQTVHVLREYLRAYRQGGGSAAGWCVPPSSSPGHPHTRKAAPRKRPRNAPNAAGRCSRGSMRCQKSKSPTTFPNQRRLSVR